MAKKVKKACYFKKNGVKHIDYKDVAVLERFVTPSGRIMSRKRTGVSSKYQRMLANAIKRSRIMGLMAFVAVQGK